MTIENDNEHLPEDQISDEIAEGSAQITALKAEIDALKDRSLRAMAEAENIRKRSEREREEARLYAVTKFARDLLNVADNLERALVLLTPEARAAAGATLGSVLDGVEATSRELSATLVRHGIKPIVAAGQRFDPNLHQAIAEVPSDTQAPGSVVNVVQPGYTIGERLLRPAMVTVAKASVAAAQNADAMGERFDRKI